MKKTSKTLVICALLLMCYPFNIKGQSGSFPLNSNGDVEFSEVIELEISSHALFLNAKKWISKVFDNYQEAIQFEDKDNHTLIAKGFKDFSPFIPQEVKELVSKEYDLSFQVMIECKDGRYRYKFNEILINTHSMIFGTSIDYSTTLTSDNEIINKLKNELDSLNAIDTKQLKRKALKEYREELETTSGLLKDKTDLHNSVHKFFLTTIDSLKVAMKVDDSF